MHSEVKPYKCDICGMAFGVKYLLNSHHKIVHERIFKSNHKCTICEKSFMSQYVLKIHFDDVHEKIRTQKCNQCSMSFKRKRHLQEHIKCVHENVKDTSIHFYSEFIIFHKLSYI